MCNEWFSHNKLLQNDISFSISNGAGKNEFVSQFTYLQPHFYIKYNEQSIITVCHILI